MDECSQKIFCFLTDIGTYEFDSLTQLVGACGEMFAVIRISEAAKADVGDDSKGPEVYCFSVVFAGEFTTGFVSSGEECSER